MPPEFELDPNADRGDHFEPTGPDAVQNTDPEPDKLAEQAAAEAGGTDPDPTEGDEGDAVSADGAEAAEEGSDSSQQASDESGAESGDKDKGKFVPKGRFDEAVRKERAEKERLEARLKELEQRENERALSEDAEEANKQLTELISQHTQLISDGELEKASTIMQKMLTLQGDIQSKALERTRKSSVQQAKQEVQYDTTVERLEADYPQINPDSEDFDPDSVNEIQSYMAGLMQMQKLTPAAALRKATTTILGPKKEVVGDEPAAKEEEAAENGLRRKEAAVKKAVETQSKQPPSTKDVGLDHDKEGGALDASSVMKMTQEEFSKLPDDKLSSLRGDFL